MAKEETKKEGEAETLSEQEQLQSQLEALKQGAGEYRIAAYQRNGNTRESIWRGDFDHIPNEQEIAVLHNERPDWWELGKYEVRLYTKKSNGQSKYEGQVTLNVGKPKSDATPIAPPRAIEAAPARTLPEIRSYKDQDTGEIFYEEVRSGRTYILDEDGKKIYDRISRLLEEDETGMDDGEGFDMPPAPPIRGKDDLFMYMLRQQQVDARRAERQSNENLKLILTLTQNNMNMLVTALTAGQKGGGSLDLGSVMQGVSAMMGTMKDVLGGGGEKGDSLMDMIGAVAPIIQSLIEAGKSPAAAVQEVQEHLKRGEMPKLPPQPEQIEAPKQEAVPVQKSETKVEAPLQHKKRSERKAEKEKK